METLPSTLVSVLRRLPLFADLSESELVLISAHVKVQRYQAGESIFSEGDVCRDLLIVAEGCVSVLKTAANGRQQLLSVERAGNSLSEVSVFDGNPYPGTAQATTASTVLRLPAEQFRRICLECPQVSLKVIKALAHRVRRMSNLIEDLSFSTVRGRLIAHLLQLAQEQGVRTSEGTEFKLAENNEQLAARLGTVRELISRNLGRLHNQGLIQMSRRKVRISDLDALAEEARPDQ